MNQNSIFYLLLLLVTAFLGCGQGSGTGTPPQGSPEVIVTKPVVKRVTDFEDFTGRTVAIPSVEIRARVTGYLKEVLFKEGTEVKKYEPLFKIDPVIYEANFKEAEASLQQAQAHLERLESDYRRAAPLLANKAISQEDFDKTVGDRNEARAAVSAAQAARDLAEQNFKWTLVTAPISGRISRQMIDPGNLVQADVTPLTTIVSLDPIYVYFDVDERTTLKVRRMIRAGKMMSAQDAKLPVFTGLRDEKDFPHQGVIDFVDNRTDPMAGSLWIRGVFPNPDRIFSPGLFVRIRTPIGQPHDALLISEQALGTDQGQSFVYVVNKNKEGKYEVEYRLVKLGLLQDGMRVVEEGLKADETVVLKGLQRIKPKMIVMPKLERKEKTAQAADESGKEAAKAELDSNKS